MTQTFFEETDPEHLLYSLNSFVFKNCVPRNSTAQKMKFSIKAFFSECD